MRKGNAGALRLLLEGAHETHGLLCPADRVITPWITKQISTAASSEVNFPTPVELLRENATDATSIRSSSGHTDVNVFWGS